MSLQVLEKVDKMESRDFYKTALQNCLTFDDVKYVWAITPETFLDEEMYILGIEAAMEGLLLAWVPEEKRTAAICSIAISLDGEAFPYVPKDVCDSDMVLMRSIRG
jgi:hypothetical protein